MSRPRTDAQAAREAASVGLSQIANIVAVGSGKGGVGKSTVTVNLAAALRSAGHRVGVLDADIYGPSQPGMLGALERRAYADGNAIIPVEQHGLKFVSMGLMLDEPDEPVIWRAPIAMKVINQFLGNVAWGELDYLLIDLPPGTGDVQLTLAQNAQLTGSVVVTTPQHVALGVAKRGVRMFERVNVPILGIVENMSGFTCSHCHEVTNIFDQGGGERLAREYDLPYLGALPLDMDIVRSGEDGVPVIDCLPDSTAAAAFKHLATNLEQAVAREAAQQGDQPTEVRLDDDGTVHITWSDGHEGRHRAYDLRIACPCAGCVDEDTGQRTLDPGSVPLDVGIEHVERIGRYALAFHFTDGHSTGLYDFKLLREMCTCDACQKQRGGDAQEFSV